MIFTLSFDEKFASLVVKGLRKLPIEEAGLSLDSFVRECNKQVEAQKAAVEQPTEESVEEIKEAEVVE